MKQTRVEKYKDYRSKLSTSNAPTLNNHYVNNDFRDTLSTTTTLPISEVYSSLDSDKNEKEEMLKLEKRKIFLKYFYISLALAILVIGFVVIGIILFKK